MIASLAAALLAAAALAEPATPADSAAPDFASPAVCAVSVDTHARTLRAEGFAAPAAKNFGLLTRDYCAEFR